MAELKDISGQRFGRLVAVSPVKTKRFVAWECVCDCGKESLSRGADLRNGKIKSCGCRRKESCAALLTKHSRCETAEYRCYNSMKGRCLNRNNKKYPSYGGRGITACARWLNGEGGKSGFQCFFDDMGAKPTSGHTLDRIDNDGGYNALNCKWSTPKEQRANQRPRVKTKIPSRKANGQFLRW